MFALHPIVMSKAQELIAAFQPGVALLLAGQGEEVTITPAMIGLVDSFWNGLTEYASPALKTVLNQEQTRYNHFQRFQGTSFAHWAGLLGIPIPSQPRIHISLTRREADRFFLALNDVPGVEFILWRSADLQSWERVPNAIVERDGVTLLFTDPAAPSGMAFYSVRR